MKLYKTTLVNPHFNHPCMVRISDCCYIIGVEKKLKKKLK